MGIIALILAIVLLAICLVLNVFILLQKKRASGLGASFVGMSSQSGTYYDKNKGRTVEGKLEFWTKLLGATFMLMCLALNILPML